jgi:anti-sigma B factor antagonist
MAMPQDRDAPRPHGQPGEVSVVYDDDQTLICLSGEIDQDLLDHLDFAQRQAIQRDLPVRIDVSAVTFMDSTGLALIVRVVAAERAHSRRVTVIGAAGTVDELLQISGVNRLVTCAP